MRVGEWSDCKHSNLVSGILLQSKFQLGEEEKSETGDGRLNTHVYLNFILRSVVPILWCSALTFLGVCDESLAWRVRRRVQHEPWS